MRQIGMRLIKQLLIRYSRVLFWVKVNGESCWPILIPGRKYLATNLLSPRLGSFIVFKNPKNKDEIFVKRITRIFDRGYAVDGLVSWASGSENFGLVNKNHVLGKIVGQTVRKLSF